MKGLLNDQKFVEGDVSVDRLQIDKCIGRGNCDVYLAENSGSRVALKQNEIKSDYEYKNFLQEIDRPTCSNDVHRIQVGEPESKWLIMYETLRNGILHFWHIFYLTQKVHVDPL